MMAYDPSPEMATEPPNKSPAAGDGDEIAYADQLVPDLVQTAAALTPGPPMMAYDPSLDMAVANPKLDP